MLATPETITDILPMQKAAFAHTFQRAKAAFTLGWLALSSFRWHPVAYIKSPTPGS